MADKTIGSLPKATAIYDDSAFVMEQSGKAMQTDAETLKDYFFGEGTNNLVVACNMTTMTANKTAFDVFAAVDVGKGIEVYLYESSDSQKYRVAKFLSVGYDAASREVLAYFAERAETATDNWQIDTYVLGQDGSVGLYDTEVPVSTSKPSTIAANAYLSLRFTPTANNHAVTKAYVDQAIQSVQESGVYSVNGQTGNVLIDIPTRLGQLTNDLGFLTESPPAESVPFQPTAGIDADNVQDALVNVQAQVAAAAAGAIPDNSISLAKLVQSELATLTEKYAVGDIYITTRDIDDPFNIFGYGQWTKLEGRFLLGSSSAYAVGDTGGEESHLLTVNELPSHNHQLGIENASGTQTGGSKLRYAYNPTSTYYSGTDMIGNTGGNQAHNNMPPYYVVHMWLRTA